MLKHKGISKKVQGDQAESNSASSDGQKRMPRSMGRGPGSAYANALDNVLGQSKELKQGSQKGFLGVEKKSIDVKEYSRSLKKK